MQRFNLVMITVLFLLTSVFSEIVKLNVAVNDLAPKGLDKNSAGIISDRLRSELINTKVFRVMERGEMQEVMREQAFQQSGVCDESSCIVEMGQVLGVDRMIAGTVGKLGSTFYTINLRMINVGSGEIILTVNEDYTGNIQGLLSIAVENAAQKLAGTASAEVKKIAMAGFGGTAIKLRHPQGSSLQ